MVAETADSYSKRQIIIRPNPSPSWRHIKIFYFTITARSATIDPGFTEMGFWMALASQRDTPRGELSEGPAQRPIPPVTRTAYRSGE